MVTGGRADGLRAAIIAAVGFNPFRPSRRRRSADYAVLAAAFVVVALLLAWAIVPR